MNNWVHIAKKEAKPEIVPTSLVDFKDNKTSVPKKSIQEPTPEYRFPNRFEQIQEKYCLEIMDVYDVMNEEVRNGTYGFVFSELKQRRCLDFINIVNNHIDYNYYRIHGHNDSNERFGDENFTSSDEDKYWGEKRNKFAYV